LTAAGIVVPGATPVTIAGISQINFLNSVADVSAVVKLITQGKFRRLSRNRLRMHLMLRNLSALALGGPLAMILQGLTGGALVLGGSATTRLSPAGVGQQWAPIFDGIIPRLYSGQEGSFDVFLRTTHSKVDFTPLFVIASIAP